MKTGLLIGLGLLVVAAAIVVAGLRVTPRPLPAYAGRTPALETVPLPAGLPAPVDRFYRAIAGDHVPVIHSVVYGGRGTVRFMGVTFPARIRFTHQAGQGYRHYMETTFWGQPLMRVNEHFLDGKSRLELPFGVVENQPKIDSAANLGLWAESLVLPSLYVTDPRVRWEPLGETTARLIVPLGEGEDSFTVTFDPATGLIRSLETIRWRDAADEAKLGWRAEVHEWQEMHGMKIPASIAAVWQDEGTPWLVSQIEEVVYNVDVSEYIRANGP